jgi:hypothetical protein
LILMVVRQMFLPFSTIFHFVSLFLAAKTPGHQRFSFVPLCLCGYFPVFVSTQV